MSRFVSAGTDVEPVERDAEWLHAQEELETNRRLKEEQSRATDDGKTLYEVLQANKAAKQEAFEEAARLKNQFRSLDDDEVDFLDSVLESTRAQEAAVRKETVEQLEVFRKQQEELEKAALAEQNDTVPILESEEIWQVGPKKRKRVREKEVLAGVKLRKSSSTASEALKDNGAPTGEAQVMKRIDAATLPASTEPVISGVLKSPTTTDTQATTKDVKITTQAVTSLGLGGYSSDED